MAGTDRWGGSWGTSWLTSWFKDLSTPAATEIKSRGKVKNQKTKGRFK